MKTFKQYITEYSRTDPGVNQHLINLGYTKLGKGVDQTAWLAKDGTVLKIFGADKQKRLDLFTKDHKMFAEWAKYCEQNSSNKFLPKFYGWETFEYSEQIYLQIKTERLHKLSLKVGLALQDVLAFYGTGVSQSKSIKQRMADMEPEEIGMAGNDRRSLNTVDGVAELILLLGEKDFNLLYDTIVNIAEIGRRNRWGIDLHKGNFMMRNDGTPVIVDPFVVIN